MINLGNLSPAPWEADKDFQLWSKVTEEVVWDQDAADFTAMVRNDQDVKQRRGWHAEKCTDADQWFVPQLMELILFRCRGLENGFEACYQRGHDVGLLTKADTWMKANIENKEETQ